MKEERKKGAKKQEEMEGNEERKYKQERRLKK
jgi:hypothetical protein